MADYSLNAAAGFIGAELGVTPPPPQSGMGAGGQAVGQGIAGGLAATEIAAGNGMSNGPMEVRVSVQIVGMPAPARVVIPNPAWVGGQILALHGSLVLANVATSPTP